MTAALTPAQFDWLTVRGRQLADVMCLDEVSVHHILASPMQGQPRDGAAALARVAAIKLAQLAGWDAAEAMELLDEMGYARAIADAA